MCPDQVTPKPLLKSYFGLKGCFAVFAPASTSLTDGLLVLRYLFGFRGAILISGTVGPNCTRCDSPSIEAYLEKRV